ncbi:hypothetical protein BDV93DRAFT_549510 [Ceratobasidium sp. AG-I]|nr:hypothetical protein BDV93DRAFT_549510 [Ceratobasidium sp. AG-I]
MCRPSTMQLLRDELSMSARKTPDAACPVWKLTWENWKVAMVKKIRMKRKAIGPRKKNGVIGIGVSEFTTCERSGFSVCSVNLTLTRAVESTKRGIQSNPSDAVKMGRLQMRNARIEIENSCFVVNVVSWKVKLTVAAEAAVNHVTYVPTSQYPTGGSSSYSPSSTPWSFS